VRLAVQVANSGTVKKKLIRKSLASGGAGCQHRHGEKFDQEVFGLWWYRFANSGTVKILIRKSFEFQDIMVHEFQEDQWRKRVNAVKHVPANKQKRSDATRVTPRTNI